MQASKQASKKAGEHAGRQASRQAAKQAKRQAAKQAKRQAGKQALGRHSVGAMPWRGLFFCFFLKASLMLMLSPRKKKLIYIFIYKFDIEK